jgi:hypothetical protein
MESYRKRLGPFELMIDDWFSHLVGEWQIGIAFGKAASGNCYIDIQAGYTTICLTYVINSNSTQEENNNG